MIAPSGATRATPAVVTEVFDAGGVGKHRRELVELLIDAVEDGASIGFLPPLSREVADGYWQSVAVEVGQGRRVVLVARRGDGAIVGSAQLELATRPNALHRAEVVKVMVHRTARRRGIGRALMDALELHARRLGRTTLVLDTRRGDVSERLYTASGYRLAGVIPAYARSADGALDATALYYRLLDGSEGGAR